MLYFLITNFYVFKWEEKEMLNEKNKCVVK